MANVFGIYDPLIGTPGPDLMRGFEGSICCSALPPTTILAAIGAYSET